MVNATFWNIGADFDALWRFGEFAGRRPLALFAVFAFFVGLTVFVGFAVVRIFFLIGM
jgi:hypothetical protein